ncbi:MAG: methyltransferase domain-containing protein [Chloroflexi bacterium]|nr:methyltransferase domain-containing protein [Chloroflexota bacterium]
MRKLAEQLSQPRGSWGQVVGVFLGRLNRPANEWTLKLLEIQPADRVLEVGFGPGVGIQEAAKLASRGWVAGVDFSETMVEQATRRNAALIATGRVELRYGDVSSLPDNDDTFDRVFGVNVIYPWREPVATLKELRRVMKPGGRIALYFVDKEDMKLWHPPADLVTLYSGPEVARLLAEAGFHEARFVIKKRWFWNGVCALAEK